MTSAPLCFGDLNRHDADCARSVVDEHVFTRLQRGFVEEHQCGHAAEQDRHGVGIRDCSWNRCDGARFRHDDELGMTTEFESARRHDPIARLEGLDAGADAFHDSSYFEAEYRVAWPDDTHAEARRDGKPAWHSQRANARVRDGDRTRMHSDQHVAITEDRHRHVFDDDDLRWPVALAHGSLHAVTSYQAHVRFCNGPAYGANRRTLRYRAHFAGRCDLRELLREYVAHYHAERNHQGLANTLIETKRDVAAVTGRVARRKRLGGMLDFYYLEAA